MSGNKSFKLRTIKAKSLLRELEFHAPPSLCSPVLKALLPRQNPYFSDNDELRCIFIHIPKTAGLSFWQAVFGIKKGHRGHIPVNRYKAYDAKKFDRYYKIAIVRNPWDRIHSAYKYLHKKIGQLDHDDGVWATRYLSNKSFPEFVQALENKKFRREVLLWKHFIPQYKWITLPRDRRARQCDEIIRFEHLNEGIQKVQKALGIQIDMPIKNRSHKVSYTEVYDRQMKRIIRDLYPQDIEMFNYSFTAE